MPGMTRADMEQVDQLMKAGNVGAARRLLESIDDPRAVKALENLKRRHPTAADVTPPPRLDPPSPTKVKASPSRVEVLPELRLDEMEEIKQMIRDKRFDDARAMLIVSDHPDADKMLARLAQIGGSDVKVKREYAEIEKDFTGRLTITIFLLIFLTLFGLIALAVWLPEAKRYPDAPGAKGLIRTNEFVTYLLRVILAVLVFIIVVAMIVGRLPR